MKLFYPNLAFEDELNSASKKVTSAATIAMSQLAPLMAWAGDRNSICVVPELPAGMPEFCVGRCVTVVDEAANDAWNLQPWGWSDSAFELARQNSSIFCNAPDLSAVRLVNRRSFLNLLDEAIDLNNGDRHQFSYRCTSLSEVSQVIQQFQKQGGMKWVAKPEFSHAGRNRLIGTGVDFNSQQTGWLQGNFRRGDAVCVEPWVSVQHEGSLHFDILPNADAAVEVVGRTGLLNDDAGRYRGSFQPLQLNTVEASYDVISLLTAHGRQICLDIQQAGYWGPVGLDFFVYVASNGQLFLRFCNDLNARWTMGRLSLEVANRLGATGVFRWEHFVTGNSAILDRAIEKSLAETGIQGVDILRTSPESVGGRDVRLGSVAIWGHSPQSKNLLSADPISSNTVSISNAASISKVAQKIRTSVQEQLSEKSSQ